MIRCNIELLEKWKLQRGRHMSQLVVVPVDIHVNKKAVYIHMSENRNDLVYDLLTN